MDWIQKVLFGKIIGNIVRHGLTVVGTWLVTHEVANAQQAQTFVDSVIALLPGLTTLILSLGSSFVHAKKLEREE